MTHSGQAFRHFTALEQGIIDRLLEKPFPGRDELCAQMKKCLVRTLDEDNSVEFFVATDVKSQVKRRIPVEAEFQDADGVLVHMLLHVVDGKVNALEIYKEDGSSLLENPDPSKLKVVCLD